MICPSMHLFLYILLFTCGHFKSADSCLALVPENFKFTLDIALLVFMNANYKILTS